MENGKQHEEEKDGQNGGSADQYQRKENEGEDNNQYTEDQGEDENGPKPSADDQD
jgi:hypothetical protein